MKRITIIFFLLCITHCGAIPERPTQFGDTATTSQSENVTDSLHIRFIDVDQGDATLITTSSGNQILIDAGTAKMGHDRVLPHINDNLELIIASHYDADHIGGIPMIMKDYIPHQGILDRGQLENIDTGDLSTYFITTAPYRWSASPGDEIMIDGATIAIIGQNGEFSDGTVMDIDSDSENGHSLSLLVTYQGIRFLTSGDLPGPNFENEYEPVDLESIVANIVGDIDILHVSHHGSHQSTNRSFLEITQPEIAIISVGENSYGHPSEVVLGNLNEIGANTYITDGDVCMEVRDKIMFTACD